jgi:plastocyanin
MSDNRRKGFVFTAVAIGILGIITGLFLGGSLLPSQGKGLLFDVRQTITTTTTTMVDDTGEHVSTKTVKTTEKVPRGYQFSLATGGGAGGGVDQGVGAVQGPYDIWLHERDYSPSLLTVPVGTKVTWWNKSDTDHTVTSQNGLFDGGLSPGDSFSYTFTKPGVYEYTCSPHPEMTGSVTVK